MTLYEELGVPQDAPADTIHEAYRNVARLLHPDGQTHPALKVSAEVQMKRINHLYEILSDPERRRRYDQELSEPPERQAPIIIQAPPSADQFRGGNHGNYAWLAAIALCATSIIWLASRESSTPVVYPQPTAETGAGSALRQAAQAILPKSAADRQRDSEIARLRAELGAVSADRDRLLRQIASAEASGRRFQPPPTAVARVPARVTMPAAAPPQVVTATPGVPDFGLPKTALPPAPPPKPRWSGSWIYTQARTENRNKSLAPPEFIETVISEDRGLIRGQYHARFKVADARISPDVDFRFEGSVTGNGGRFPWIGTGGARGEVQVRLVSDTTLEVVWSATELGKTMGLSSGTAELKRKN
ncbi:MAG TPA: DnaJ domain-containing protein [Bryobacteraceae bacterium]|jgi:curved DNA-binding protein CbpA